MISTLINLQHYSIILASKSPRRQELLKGLGLTFQVHVLEGIDESYPDTLPLNAVAEYLAKKKANAYNTLIKSNELVITADTVVVSDSTILGKPANRDEAINMLMNLSGKTHQVITGVCLNSHKKQVAFSSSTDVTFDQLSHEECAHYVDSYRPFDKAGAYGIQEWIGYIGVDKINGSFYNVMGLPLHALYQILKTF